jgi:hypothetical protein
MRRLLIIAVACVLWASPVHAAIEAVAGQLATGSGDDATLTFPGAWGASNHVIVGTLLTGITNTAELTGITASEVTLHGPAQDSGGTWKLYIWCFQGDGSDNTVIVTTNASATARSAGVEISGGTCTEDGTSSSNDTTGTSHALTVDITTTQAGSFMFSMIRGATTNYTATGGSSPIPADGTDINGEALGAYRVLGAAGAYDADFSSTASETSYLGAAAVQPAAVVGGSAKSLMLMGVGD